MLRNMNLPDNNSNDSFLQYNLNQAGLEQAEQNYFMKYATSGISEVNNTQRISKRIDTKIISPDSGTFSKMKSTQNDVLRELKQEYEILRNLPIDEKIDVKSKAKVKQQTSSYSSSIDESSEITSSRPSRTKKHSREAQILGIEKKQLEIVIGNSLKKIEELLQNEMQLKKTIHELKLQIQGKGGIHSEYEMQIRNFRKNEKEMQETIDNLKTEIQRRNSQIKQLSEKNAFLEGEKSRRDQEHKSFYDIQRQLEDLLRKEKDRCMNAELQAKRIQMELEIYQKDKTAQINRLNRELEFKSQSPDRQAETIRRLEEEIRMKDHKIESFVDQIESLRAQIIRPVSPKPVQQDQQKNVLEELVRQMKRNESQSKDNSEVFMKAILDKLGARKDEGLKNEITNLRAQVENIRRNSVSDMQMQSLQTLTPSAEIELKTRIRELQRVIDEEKRQKRDLLEQINRLKNQRDSVYEEMKSHKQAVREYQQTEERLLYEIEQLSNFKIELQQSKMENTEIREKLENILSGHQIGNQTSHQEVIKIESHVKQGFIDVEKYEEEIRMLRRTNDELSFALNKANQEKAMTEGMLREEQGKEILRLNQDIARYRQLLKTNDEQLTQVNLQLKAEIQAKTAAIEAFTHRLQEADKLNKQTLEASRANYENLLKAEVTKHYAQLQAMNQKMIELTKTNETFSTQAQYFMRIEKQVSELRRLTRTQKKSNEAIDHLWEIKEAEYGNINQILSSVRI